MRRTNGLSGFTLIELMIVIAVIGALATIALPEYQAYKTRVFDKTAMSDAVQFRNYVANFGEFQNFTAFDEATLRTYFPEASISGDVKFRAFSMDFGSGTAVLVYLCHAKGEVGYAIDIPYSETNPLMAFTPNVVDESAVWRVAAGC